MTGRDPLTRFIDAVVRGRRPPRFRASEEDARLLRTAALLGSTRPGADLPREEFLRTLEERLRRELSPATMRPALDRRRFLRGAGLAAAATALGLGIDRAILALESAPTGSPTTRSDLVPDGATWRPVATVAEVRAHGPLAFRVGAVDGYLVAAGADILALSAICTHLGCRLSVAADRSRLDCPCHGASFTLDGTPRPSEYLHQVLRPLPRLRTRVVGDSVEVLA